MLFKSVRSLSVLFILVFFFLIKINIKNVDVFKNTDLDTPVYSIFAH